MALSRVQTDGITDSAITAVKIADGTVVAAEIAADAVDGTKIADNAIDSEHYTDGSIDLAHLAADAVDGTKIADNAIDSEHYTDGSIDLAHMSVNSIDSDQYVDASIDEAHIAADAVNFVTHLKAGTDGELITWDASGNPAAVAVGTATHVLTSGGVGVAPTFQAAAGGGDLVFLAEDTAGAATKEFTSADGIDTSVYDNYLFQFEGVWPTTQGSDLQCTFYSDDGSTALTSAVYRYVVNGTDTNGVELRHSSTNATTMNLTPSGDMRASGTNFGGGKVWLKLTSGSNYWTHHLEMDFVEWATNDLHTTQGHFRYFGSTALPAVKFHTSSGNINGTIRMYGLKKS